MSKSQIMTGVERHEYRRSMRQRADKSRVLTRREARRLKRKEGTGIDIECSVPKREYPLPPLSLLWDDTRRWVEEFGSIDDEEYHERYEENRRCYLERTGRLD